MKVRAALLLPLLAAAGPLGAHDLFFRLNAPRPAAGSTVAVRVLSGSFGRSENAIKRDRLADLSLSGPDGRHALDPAAWSEGEPETVLQLTLGGPGGYVVGAALHPRPLALPAAQFNAYLAEEGMEGILALRKTQGRLGEGSKERYTKFLKIIIQAGDSPAGSAATTALGYAAEIVPLEDPATLAPGATLHVRCLVDGAPLAGAVIFAGGRRADLASESRARQPVQRIRTDAQGVGAVRLEAAGAWYVKFVHMSEVHEPDFTYDSKWSSLSFAVAASALRSAR